jgi:hypothetical protein
VNWQLFIERLIFALEALLIEPKGKPSERSQVEALAKLILKVQQMERGEHE